MVWNPYSSPIDYIKLADKRSPGIADIEGASSIRDWDIRKGPGLTGAFSVFMGRNLAKFSVRLRLYTVQHWDDWHAWKPIVDRLPTRRGGGRGPDTGHLSIWHPLLEELDITAVGVAEVMQPVQSGDGEWMVEIKFIEFRHPKIGLAKPEGAAATPVDDPVDQEIGRLFDVFQVERLAHD